MKSKFTIVTVLVLSSAIYCRAGLFDKLNNAINTALPVANTNPPAQKPTANPPAPSLPANQPDQNSQVTNANIVETPQPSATAATLQANNVESKSGQNTNVSPQIVKAYKTLSFGDNSETVNNKLAEILGVPDSVNVDGKIVSLNETFWRSLFDTDADYGPFTFDSTKATQSNKLRSLMGFFEKDTITVHSCANSAISVDCYQLYDTVSQGGSLAAVEVSYITFDLDKLVAGYMQNYPNARKENKSYKFENTMYPGVFIEFERTFFTDINQDMRATLSIPTEKFTITFTEPAKLSKEQLAVWEALMTKDGKTTQLDEYFASVKTMFLDFVKSVESDVPTSNTPNGPKKRRPVNRLDALSYQGWYDSSIYNSLIYGHPNAVFASKQILEPLMNNYRQSIEAADQEQKAKLKKDSDSSSGF